MTIGREDVIISNKFFPNAIALNLPGDLGGSLEFLHILFAGRDAARRNWADGKGAATIIGAPVEADGYLQFKSGQSGLRTAMRDSFAATTLAIVSRDVSSAPGADPLSRFFHIGSSAGSGDLNGLNVYTASTARTQMNARYQASGGNSTSSPASDPSLALGLRIAKAGGADSGLSYENMTSGAAAADAVPVGTTRLGNNQYFSIGTEYSAAWGGFGDVALAAGWSRILTADEDDLFYEWAQDLCASVGLAI